MTRTDKQVHDETTEASFDQTIQFSELRFYACTHDEGPYVIFFAGEKGRQHEEQRLVHFQYKRAHHRQYSSPSDLGCNISTGNTRSSDVLDLPLSGVTLVIVSSASPVLAVAATTSRDASLALTTTRTATLMREMTTSTTATTALITTLVRVFGARRSPCGNRNS
ncbi:hypothetical protein D6D17_05123 [Aureobasidium pullulans]|nr:hypothetical protein D6D29_07293 [Aureobasidium pullulans]THX05418.1 hypothetical protein D6D17_05123 [Aureobasidium pullulans]